MCTCVSVAFPHCVVEVAMCTCVSVASFMVPHCVVEAAMCACVSVALFPGSCGGRGKKSMVHTVCACSVPAGILWFG